jgi:hypothetical protein
MSTASRVDSLMHDDPPHRLSQKLAHFSTRHQAPLVITDWMMPDITGIELTLWSYTLRVSNILHLHHHTDRYDGYGQSRKGLLMPLNAKGTTSGQTIG